MKKHSTTLHDEAANPTKDKAANSWEVSEQKETIKVWKRNKNILVKECLSTWWF